MLSFFEGIIAAFGALVLELIPSVFGLAISANSLIFILFAATIEEAIKYSVIYANCQKLRFKEKIILNSFFIGMGFAATEIFLKQLSLEKTLSLPVLGIFSIHILTTLLSGFSLSREDGKMFFSAAKIILANIALHFVYNFATLRWF